MRNRFVTLARLLAPLAILGLLAFFVDLPEAARALAGASPGPVALALVLVQLQIVLAAIRWRETARRIGQSLPLRRAIGEYYGASLLNLVLPGGVSGDIIRVARNRRTDVAESDWGIAAQAVILERGAGQIAFAAVAFVGLAAWPWIGPARLPQEAASLLTAAAGVILLGVPTLLLLARFGQGWIGARLSGFACAAVTAYVRRGAWVLQTILSLLIVATYLAVFALCSDAVGASLSIGAALALIPLTLLTMLVPVSVGGWGVREAAAAALWPLAGFSAADGVAASVLYGLVSTAGALPGLFTFAFPGSRRVQPKSSQVSHARASNSCDDKQA